MFSVAFSGPAGTGVNTAGLIIGSYFAKLGKKVYADKEYQSIIKGGNNTIIVYIDKNDIFLSNKIDLFFAFDELAIQRNQKIYTLENIIKLPANLNGLAHNMVSVGYFFALIGKNLEEMKKIIDDYFSYKTLDEKIKNKNYQALEKGFELAKESKLNINFPPELLHKNKNSYELKDGNKVVADGAIKGGLEFYAAYPMTPASTLIKYLSPKVTFFQGEDEISVSMAMLGARFAGKRSMCGTSGGGFALMTESISFANQAEIGGLYILSQRGGPSTGTPTFTEQGDLLFALNASFGDTKPIVIYPNTFENGYLLIQKALDWAEIYQHPIVFLLDKQFSESYISLRSEEFKEIRKEIKQGEVESEKGKVERKDTSSIFFNPEKKEEFEEYQSLIENKFLRYKTTETGISAYTYPGVKNGEFIASSYEHTESGFSTEDPEIKQKMTEKRHKKLETFVKNEFNENFYGFKIINENAKNFIITTGINHLVCKKFVESNPEWGLITITMLQPLDPRLEKYLDSQKVKKIVFVELNYSGQLEEIVSKKFGLNCSEWNGKISHIRKYNNYPLFIEDLEKL